LIDQHSATSIHDRADDDDYDDDGDDDDGPCLQFPYHA